MGFADRAATLVTEIFTSPMTDSTLGRRDVSLEAAPGEPPQVVTSHFKLVFIAMLCLTVAAGAVEVWLAVKNPNPSEVLKNAIGAMDFAWKAGIGAIFGLIGGKAS